MKQAVSVWLILGMLAGAARADTLPSGLVRAKLLHPDGSPVSAASPAPVKDADAEASESSTSTAVAGLSSSSHTDLGNIFTRQGSAPAQEGTDGTGIVGPTGGVGIRGWLSGIWYMLTHNLSVTGTVTSDQGSAGSQSWKTVEDNSAAFSSSSHTDAGILDTDIRAFSSSSHTDAGNIYTRQGSAPSQEHTAANSPNACGLSDGASFYTGAKDSSVTAFSSSSHSDFTTLDGDLKNFSSASHTDVGQVDTDVKALSSSSHSDLGLLATDSHLTGFSSSSHTDLGAVDTDIRALSSSSHSDLGLLATDAHLTSFSSSSHTDAGTIATNVNNFSSSSHTDASAIDTDLRAFSSASHTDVGAVATDVNNFSSSSHTDAGTIATNINNFSSSSHTDATGGGAKGQRVDGSGNVAPAGDTAARAGFVRDQGELTFTLRNDYSTTPVTSTAYVAITASTAVATTRCRFADTGGYTMILAKGGAGAEVDGPLIPPGGWDQPVDWTLAQGTRLSLKVKPSSSTVSLGEFVAVCE